MPIYPVGKVGLCDGDIISEESLRVSRRNSLNSIKIIHLKGNRVRMLKKSSAQQKGKGGHKCLSSSVISVVTDIFFKSCEAICFWYGGISPSGMCPPASDTLNSGQNTKIPGGIRE